MSAADGDVQMEMLLEIENIGGPVASPVLQAVVRYDAGGITHAEPLNIAANDLISHRFPLDLPPGVTNFTVDFGAAPFEFDIDISVADIRIRNVDYEVADDGFLNVTIKVENDGDLVATNVLAMAYLEADGPDAATTSDATVDILPGDSRDIVVMLPVPEGTHAIAVAVSTESLEADLASNSTSLEAEAVYVGLELDYQFDSVAYWSDGSANVQVSIVASNQGTRAYRDAFDVAYTCAGPSRDDDEVSGTARMLLPDGYGPATESFMLRSSAGTMTCEFDAGDDTDLTDETYRVPEKIIGVDPTVWECYSDLEINRQGDFGCAGWDRLTVAKWDTDAEVKVWATGDQGYIDVLWEVLERLEPLLGMEFTETEFEDDADLSAWMGTEEDAAPDSLNCFEAGGCATWDADADGRVVRAEIGVWPVDQSWIIREGWVDRQIEHVTLHELLHALVPLGHQDDPLSVVNNRGGASWTEIDPFHADVIRLHRNPVIEPGMTMDDVREVVVLAGEVVDPVPIETAPAELTAMQLLREAYRVLINAETASWRLEGGWQGPRCDKEFGRAQFTAADYDQYGPDAWRFFSGSDRMYRFWGWPWDRENWTRQAGEWLRDDPDFWSDTHFRSGFADVMVLLQSALYFGVEEDMRVSTNIPGVYTIRPNLESVASAPDWARGADVYTEVALDIDTYEIRSYTLNWNFDARPGLCERYLARASDGQYNVPFEVDDYVYGSTTADNRRLLDAIRNLGE